MLFDTHSHLNLPAFDKDRYEVANKCLRDNIWMINVGIDYESSRKAVEIAQRYKEGVFAAVGLHPENLGKEVFRGDRYKALAESPKVVAIGEIGLDFWQLPKEKEKQERQKDMQKRVLEKEILLAQELGLPIIFHCRKAHNELIEILKNIKGRKLCGVIHCFTGNITQAKEYLSMGFYLGFNGIVFKMDLDNVLQKVPMEKMLVETDCPYLTPPQEGKRRNRPEFVKYVVRHIAEAKQMSLNEVAAITAQNAKTLFCLEK